MAAYTETGRKKIRTFVGAIPAVAAAVVTLTVPEISDETTAEGTISIPGARIGDAVFCQLASSSAGISIASAKITGPNECTIVFGNFTDGTIGSASAVLQFLVIRN